MSSLLPCWLLSCFGLTWMITRSVIFAPLRALAPKPMGTTPFWGTLLRCPQCMGFWVGAFHALGGFPLLSLGVEGSPFFGNADLWPARILSAMYSGFVASGAGYLGMLVCEKLGQGPLDE